MWLIFSSSKKKKRLGKVWNVPLPALTVFKMLTFLKPYISASISISERSGQFNPIKGNRTVLQCQSIQCLPLSLPLTLLLYFQISIPEHFFSPLNWIFKINCLLLTIRSTAVPLTTAHWVDSLQKAGFLHQVRDIRNTLHSSLLGSELLFWLDPGKVGRERI